MRPEAPEPKKSNFRVEIIGTQVIHAGDKVKISVDFDSELDTREFGFGLDIAGKWETEWSNDGKRVTLTVDYYSFPAGSSANVIIFRLKDTDGNIIPGPKLITLDNSEELMKFQD